MYYPVPITNDTFWIGVNDLETDLFEAIWPIPQGITYNSYLIVDQKIAIIDSVKGEFFNLFIDKIHQVLPEGKTVDYMVINHMEPDHSGSIRALMALYPNLKILGNKKTAEFLNDFYDISSRVNIIEDNESIDLGAHRLIFSLTPMVHWPETMMTYDFTDKMIFSGDVFGGFGAFSGPIFDDEVDMFFYEREILRYFSNIIGKYSSMVNKAIAKIDHYDIRIVAPTHGPIFRTDPSFIIDKYSGWSNYENQTGATIVYGSMYNNTEHMAQTIARTCVELGIPVSLKNLSREHYSYAITDCWKYKNLFIGTPTYNTKLFPPVHQFIYSLDDKFLQTRKIAFFGSYSWSGGGVKKLIELSHSGKWNVVEPIVEVKSSPTEEDLKNCIQLARNAIQ